jgi:hypothetical protein
MTEPELELMQARALAVGEIGDWVRLEPGDVVVSRGQRSVHVASESVAVLAVVPFMLYLATRKELPRWARIASGVIAAGTLVVDGGLLARYLSDSTDG